MGVDFEFCPICKNVECEFVYVYDVIFVDDDKFDFLRNNKNYEIEDLKNYPSYHQPTICDYCVEELKENDKIIYDNDNGFLFVRKKDFQIFKYVKIIKIKKEDCNNYENF